MAIIKFIKVRKGNLKNAIKYITREDKTDENLIYCMNCQIESAIDEFEVCKKMYNKLDGRKYYHFIQSFSPKDKLDYETANKIGQELCNHFKDYQIVMTTHKDKDYIHNHFIMNSVNMVTGEKYHQNKYELEKIKELSNKICSKYNLKQISIDKNTNSKFVSQGEYYLSKRQMTQKQKLIKNINECIKISKTKEQFIFLMNQKGYKVNWKDTRNYITYTTPENMKFRDIRLNNLKYTKEKMELYLEKVKRKNIRNSFIRLSLLNKKQHTENGKKVNNDEYSDIAKKDFIKQQENASSIEWE